MIEVSNMFLEDTKRYCFLPYPNHPKGCPNCYGKCWGKRDKQVMIDTLIDMNRPIYIVYNEFNLEAHAQRMKSKHPHWSDRQCRCVLYWQSTSRKQLKERVAVVLQQLKPKPNFVTYIPELYGVNIYKTCETSGLVLDEINNMKICRHIALLGYNHI